MASEFDLDVDQGSDWDQLLEWVQADGSNPVILTGYTARMQIRHQIEDQGVLITLTSDPGDGITIGELDGTVLLEMTATQTATLPAERGQHRHFYDLEMVAPSGRVRRLIQGRVIVSAEVTR